MSGMVRNNISKNIFTDYIDLQKIPTLYMPKLLLPFLETMVTQVCNLSCKGCTNYSDQRHSGYVSWAQGRTWLEPWLDLIDVPDFGIMGGEPLINPEIQLWLLGARALMPNSQLRFTTNGLLLHKWPDLIPLLHDIGNCVFKITVHVDDPELENTIKEIFSRYHWNPVTEYGISRWKTTNNLTFQINRPTQFLKTFQGPYHNMVPFNSNPAAAFDVCVQKTCPLLHQGRIYKCSTSALLLDTLDRYNRPNWEQWAPYIESGISPESDYQFIVDFVNNFGKPHFRCKQCPDSTAIPLQHLFNVKRK
jgi:sulfatase maturation enzyme AslB (radical SAM superfamily)